jgi:hypothetical protein
MLRPIPASLTRWFGGWQAGIAGMLLVVSVFFSAPKLGLFTIPAAMVAMVGGQISPSIGPLSGWLIASMIGIAISGIGIRLTRD